MRCAGPLGRSLVLVAALASAHLGLPRHTLGGSPDAPMFRGGPDRTGAMPGPGVGGTPAERWRFEVDGAVFTSPVVVDEVVYDWSDLYR